MAFTQQQIVDEIFQRFADVWTDTGFTVLYPDRVLTQFQTDLVAGTNGVELQPWARLTIRTGSRDQKTFGHSADSGRMFETRGILMVEVYTPTGDGHTQAYELATLVRNAYEGISSPYKVWYPSVMINENGSEGLWSRVNVIVEWQAEDRR